MSFLLLTMPFNMFLVGLSLTIIGGFPILCAAYIAWERKRNMQRADKQWEMLQARMKENSHEDFPHH